MKNKETKIWRTRIFGKLALLVLGASLGPLLALALIVNAQIKSNLMQMLRDRAIRNLRTCQKTIFSRREEIGRFAVSRSSERRLLEFVEQPLYQTPLLFNRDISASVHNKLIEITRGTNRRYHKASRDTLYLNYLSTPEQLKEMWDKVSNPLSPSYVSFFFIHSFKGLLCLRVVSAIEGSDGLAAGMVIITEPFDNAFLDDIKTRTEFDSTVFLGTNILATSVFAKDGNRLLYKPADLKTINKEVSANPKSSSTFRFDTLNGNPVLYVYGPLFKDLNPKLATIAMPLSMDHITTLATTTTWLVFGTAALIFILVYMLGIMGVRNLVQPVMDLSRGLERMRHQNFDYRLTLRSQDEIGKLAKSFNRMADRLQESFSTIQQTALKQEKILQFSSVMRQCLEPDELRDSFFATLLCEEGLGYERILYLVRRPEQRRFEPLIGLGPFNAKEATRWFESLEGYRRSLGTHEDALTLIRDSNNPLTGQFAEYAADYVFSDRKNSVFHIAAMNRSALLVSSDSFEKFHLHKIAQKLGLTRFLLAPIWVKDKLQALLLLDFPISRQIIDPTLESLTMLLVNQYTSALENLILFEKTSREKVEHHEITLAREIQRLLLPETIPQIRSLGIHCYYSPMREVGGDFYDFISPSEDHIGILISDVSGHGIPAALITSMEKIAVQAFQDAVCEPAFVLNFMNHSLFTNLAGNFVTAFCGAVDIKNEKFHFSNAGHMPPLLLRNNETTCSIQEIKIAGRVLGLYSDTIYSVDSIPLTTGDRILLYTDGLTDSVGRDNSQYGDTRLKKYLVENRHLDAKAYLDGLVEDLAQFRDIAVQEDDLAIILLEYVPNGN